MKLKAPSAGMGPQDNRGRPFQFRAAARSSVERGKSGKLDAARSAKIGVGASGFWGKRGLREPSSLLRRAPSHPAAGAEITREPQTQDYGGTRLHLQGSRGQRVDLRHLRSMGRALRGACRSCPAACSIPIDRLAKRKDTHWLSRRCGGRCRGARHTACNATMPRGLAMSRRNGRSAAQDLCEKRRLEGPDNE